MLSNPEFDPYDKAEILAAQILVMRERGRSDDAIEISKRR